MTKINKLCNTNFLGTPEMKSNRENYNESSKSINMTLGHNATKKISNNDIEEALREPSARKAVNQLLTKSPVGLGLQSKPNELGLLGYTESEFKEMHIGAPTRYNSSDGGTITVYDDIRMGNTDVGPRTTIYETSRYKQTIVYNDSGEPTKGTITIKDDIGGFIEEKYNFEIKDGKVTNITY